MYICEKVKTISMNIYENAQTANRTRLFTKKHKIRMNRASRVFSMRSEIALARGLALQRRETPANRTREDLCVRGIFLLN